MGPTEFRIPRALLNHYLDHQAEVMRAARMVPETKAGKFAGVRMAGIRPGTLFDRLGLKNGDRLQSINGHSLEAREAIKAYTELRGPASSCKVSLLRAGKKLELRYRIVE